MIDDTKIERLTEDDMFPFSLTLDLAACINVLILFLISHRRQTTYCATLAYAEVRAHVRKTT
jgi:hypothetical protein